MPLLPSRPTVPSAHLMPVRTIQDPRGSLAVVEAEQDIPFGIKRIYMLYDVPADIVRGHHAHKELHQLMIALGGEVEVTLDDGCTRTRYVLSSPEEGLYVPPGYWRELEGFSDGATCLVLASAHYDEGDYIRDYDAFKEWARTYRSK